MLGSHGSKGCSRSRLVDIASVSEPQTGTQRTLFARTHCAYTGDRPDGSYYNDAAGLTAVLGAVWAHSETWERGGVGSPLVPLKPRQSRGHALDPYADFGVVPEAAAPRGFRI